MNGFEKIEIGKKFDTLSDEQKDELYNKYGKDIVDEEIARCKVAASLASTDSAAIADVDVTDMINLFSKKASEEFGETLKILQDIRDM